MVWPRGTNSLWMMSLLSKKAIDSVLTLDFCRRLYFGRGEVGAHHVVDCRFDSGSNWQHQVSSPVTMFSRSNGPWSHMEMKSPEVSIRFAFCLSESLCGTNWEQIFHLPRSSATMVCAVSLLMPNSTAVNLKAGSHLCGAMRRVAAKFSCFKMDRVVSLASLCEEAENEEYEVRNKRKNFGSM